MVVAFVLAEPAEFSLGQVLFFVLGPSFDFLVYPKLFDWSDRSGLPPLVIIWLVTFGGFFFFSWSLFLLSFPAFAPLRPICFSSFPYFFDFLVPPGTGLSPGQLLIFFSTSFGACSWAPVEKPSLLSSGVTIFSPLPPFNGARVFT